MRKIEQKANPTILNLKVRFRNSKGRYTKPHLATYVEFIPLRARKPVVYEIRKEKGQRLTKAYAFEAAHQAIVQEHQERDRKRITKEQEKRGKLPAIPRKPKPKFPPATVSRTDTITHSRSLGAPARIVGYNYTFKKKIAIYPDNFEVIRDFLKGMMSEAAIQIFKKDKAYGKLLYARVFGDGFYMRNRHGRRKKDTIGFSVSRARVSKPEHIRDHIAFTLDLMEEAFVPHRTKSGTIAGYFAQRFDQNEYYITGFRIEWADTLT